MLWSGHRIATAEEGERARVIGEEFGGQAGGYVGSAAGVGVCVVFGLATGGWGLLGCAIVGGAAGGMGGTYIGGEIGEQFQGTGEVLSNPVSFMEGAALFDTALTGSSAAADFYEAREIITGEPSPFEDF